MAVRALQSFQIALPIKWKQTKTKRFEIRKLQSTQKNNKIQNHFSNVHTLITNWSAHFFPSQSWYLGALFLLFAVSFAQMNFPISLLRSMRDLLIAIIFLSNGNNRCFSTWWFLFHCNFNCARVVCAHARIDHLFAPRRSLYTAKFH